jgi:hypothetical protein
MPDDLAADDAAAQPAPTPEPVPAEPTDGAAGVTAPEEAEAVPAETADPAPAPVAEPAAAPGAAAAPADSGQSSLAAPPAARSLNYAVDIVFCIDVTGSMTPILDAVKSNALRFYEDVQTNLTAKGKIVDELRVRVVAFRDLVADGEAALAESPFFLLPGEQAGFSDFVGGLVPEGGGDAPSPAWKRCRSPSTPTGRRAATAAARSSSCGPTSRRSRSTRPRCPRSCSPGCPVTSAR